MAEAQRFDGAALGRGLAAAVAQPLNKLAYVGGELLDQKAGAKGFLSNEVSTLAHNVFVALQKGGVLPSDQPLPAQLLPTAWVKAALPLALGAGVLIFLLARATKPKVIEVRRG